MSILDGWTVPLIRSYNQVRGEETGEFNRIQLNALNNKVYTAGWYVFSLMAVFIIAICEICQSVVSWSGGSGRRSDAACKW